jgi:hypothetical protein
LELGQIRVETACLGFGGARSRGAGSEAKRGEAGVPGGCSSAAKGPAKTPRRAAPLAQSSPPGKKSHEYRGASEVGGSEHGR